MTGRKGRKRTVAPSRSAQQLAELTQLNQRLRERMRVLLRDVAYQRYPCVWLFPCGYRGDEPRNHARSPEHFGPGEHCNMCQKYEALEPRIEAGEFDLEDLP